VNCPATTGVPLQSRDLYRAGISRLFDAPRGHYDRVDVHQYRAAGAEMAMREVRDRIRRCALVEVRLDEDKAGYVEWTLLAEDFAGDDSVMVRYRIRESDRVTNTDYRLIVRQRDLVADAWFSDQRWTRTQMNAVAVRLGAAEGPTTGIRWSVESLTDGCSEGQHCAADPVSHESLASLASPARGRGR
jgi:hypothetical protein